MVLVFIVGLNALVQKKKKNWGGLRFWWFVTVVNQAPLEPDLQQ